MQSGKIQAMQKGKFVLYHSKQRKGNAVYVYYMIAWYFRKNKKSFRQTIKHLGRLTKSEVEFYNNSVACLNDVPHMYPCNVKKLCVQKSHEYLSCAVGIHFWDDWDLSTVFQEQQKQKPSEHKEVSTADIAKILTVIRYLRPCSKTCTTALYQETCLPQLTGVSPRFYNKTRLFRELEAIERHREALGKHIFEVAVKKGCTNGGVLFYDLSSGNITGLRCVMAKWGHCKDGYQTHVVLLLVITSEGYPIYWEVLEGNTAEVTTLEALIAKIERLYGRVESVFCFDRGMVSDDNLHLLETKHIRFITALDGNQLTYFKEWVDFALFKRVKAFDLRKDSRDIETCLTQHKFISAQRNLFYKEMTLTDAQKKAIEKQTSKLALETRRYFLAFNPELAYLSHKSRKKRVQAFKEWVEEYNQELSHALGDRKQETIEKALKKELKRRKIADVAIQYVLTGYRVENMNKAGKKKQATTYKVTLGEIPEESYEESQKHDGLWVLITNIREHNDIDFFHTTAFESYFEIYRLKNKIEESFRILSNFVAVEPFYVYKNEHIQAHFTICVLSYLLDITMLNTMRGSENIENMDLHALFHIIRKCKQDIIQLDEKTVIAKLTQLTEQQKRILDVLNCSYLVSSEYLLKKNIISSKKSVRRNDFSTF